MTLSISLYLIIPCVCMCVCVFVLVFNTVGLMLFLIMGLQVSPVKGHVTIPGFAAHLVYSQ